MINIHRFDNEIKLYIKNLKNGDYLITNTLNYFKNIYYYFNTCYLNNNDKEVIDIKINTNNLEENIITFKREDGIVYDFIDSFNTDYEVKEGLTSLIRLKNLINLNNDKPKEVISPEEYSELLFGVNNIEELEFLKEIRLNGLLHNSLKLDQYKEECGIDTYSSYWKVNSKNPIGNMLLQSLYINKINKRIHELKKEKK